MLTVETGPGHRECSGVSRRDFLRVGTLGLGSFSLPGLLAARAETPGYLRDKAVVFLYLSGGASHIETFNPNMDAPAPYHSLTGDVKTTVPGMRFGGTFPLLARHAHEMAVVRSFAHPIGGHQQAHVHVLSGGTDPRGDGEVGHSIGSLYARLRGASSPETGMPTYSLLTHEEIDGQYRKEIGRVIKGSAPGDMGAGYAPFRYHQGGKVTKRRLGKGEPSFADDMKLNLPADRFGDRQALLAALDGVKRRVDRADEVDKYRRQAIELLLGDASKAFDLSSEDPRLVERYDTSTTMIGHKQFRKSTLGRQMLMARRLCEAGAGFVTVHSAGWDMHADGNNPGMVKGMNMLGSTLDKAVSAFLEDVKARGLNQKILLVITGDFGRTPKVNKKGGRDHWARLGTLAFAGGGLKTGWVVGRSDRRNGEPDSEAVTPRHMMMTIMHSLIDVGELRVARGVPRDLLALLDGGEPIRELL